jgi:hypothetical protein
MSNVLFLILAPAKEKSNGVIYIMLRKCGVHKDRARLSWVIASIMAANYFQNIWATG